MGFGKYIKTAFANRWNLLALFGGLGFSFLSGRPDVLAPLVLAAEAAYLGLLGTHPRFQQSVDAQSAAAERQEKSQSSHQALRQIIQSLPGPSLSRFEKLRARCMELRQIAADLQNTQSSESGAPLDSIQVASLDRLLWIFLRMLFTEYSLNKFLERTNLERIQADVEAFELRLKRMGPEDQSPHSQKIRKTLEDSLQTSKDRLANYEKAQANHELVQLEIDRLESKIKSLAELSVNRQEPDFISSQVDQVAGSMLETEKTMNELQFVTGLAPIDEEIPELVRTPPIQIVR
jgi:DNA repair exonuclease SbcCD ATPase subunit